MTLLNASWNLDVNVKGVSKRALQGELWWYNSQTNKRIYVQNWSRTLSTASGHNELIIDLFANTQTSIDYTILERTAVNPLTRQKITFEYAVIRHIITRWVNGELQFEKSGNFEELSVRAAKTQAKLAARCEFRSIDRAIVRLQCPSSNMLGSVTANSAP
jgi:hypothetical protein